MLNLIHVVFSIFTVLDIIITVFSLKYRTAKNNSKWECVENFRELLIIELKCESFMAPVFHRDFFFVS